MNRTARWGIQLAAATAAQVVLATATASAGPTARPCQPAVQQQPPVQVPVLDPTPVRRGDLCSTGGHAAYAEPGLRLVTCGRWRGLNHLTWGP